MSKQPGITNADIKAFSDDLYAIQSSIRKLEDKHPKLVRVFDGQYGHALNEIYRDTGQLAENVGIELWDDDAPEIPVQ